MLKIYCKGYYKSQRSEDRSHKTEVRRKKFFPLLSVFCRLTSAFCLLFTVTGCAGSQTAHRDIKGIAWETYLFSNQRHGNTADPVTLPMRFSTSFMIARAPVFKFFSPFYPEEHSSPAIVDNIAYVGTADKFFYAIDLENGKGIWEFKTTGAVESSPTVAHGMVYFGTNDGKLYCLDVKDGREVWRFQANTEIVSSPVVDEGVVYFNSADDKLYALKAETGERLWHYSRAYIKNVVKRISSSPAVYANRIYCNFTDGYIVAIEKSSGREVWKRKTGKSSEVWDGGPVPARFTPAIDGGLVYLITDERYIIALDANSGEERWRFDIIKASDFAIDRSYIFIAGQDGSLIAMKKGSGEIIWRGKVSQGNPVSVIAVDKYLVVSSNYKTEGYFSSAIGSSIDIFSIDDGKRLWNENIDSTTSTSLSSAYNRLLLVSDNGYLKIFGSDIKSQKSEVTE